MRKIEVISEALCIVGESPLYDATRRTLHYLDIYGRRIRSVAFDSGAVSDRVVEQPPGALVLSRDGRLLVCMGNGVYRINRPGAAPEPLFAPLPIAGLRFNDVKAGPDGALYGGTFSRDASAAFYRLDATGRFRMLFDRVGNSNGLDWDMARRVMYYVDTPRMCCDAFDFDPESGTLANRRTVRRFSDADGRPDGLTLDCEGKLWIALWGHGAVVRLDPDSGRIVDRIVLPAGQVSCCAFAGDDWSELIVTSAAYGMDLRREPLAGALFRIRVPVPGRECWKFKLGRKTAARSSDKG